MFIYATTKEKDSNPIIVEGQRVFRDSDGIEYKTRADLVLSVRSTPVVIDREKCHGFKKNPYIACQYVTNEKDFIGRNIPITVCMKRDDLFDMSTIRTLWKERYELSIPEVSKIQDCLETLAQKSNPFSIGKIVAIAIAILLLILIIVYFM